MTGQHSRKLRRLSHVQKTGTVMSSSAHSAVSKPQRQLEKMLLK